MTRRRTSLALRCWQGVAVALALLLLGCVLEAAARGVEWVAGR